MKKLKLQMSGIKELLTKEQMKKISGGYETRTYYNCRCSTYGWEKDGGIWANSQSEADAGFAVICASSEPPVPPMTLDWCIEAT